MWDGAGKCLLTPDNKNDFCLKVLVLVSTWRGALLNSHCALIGFQTKTASIKHKTMWSKPSIYLLDELLFWTLVLKLIYYMATQRSSTHRQCFIMQRLFVSYRKPSCRQQFQEKTVFSLLYHKCINYGKIQAAGGSLGTLFKVAVSVLDTLLCLICKIERSDSEKFFFVGHFTVD